VDDRDGELSEPILGPVASRDAMLLVLTCAAGLVDAISYLELGHVFTAMMTGNTVLLALAIGQGEVMAALRSTLALAAFSVGAAGSAMVLLRGGARREWPPIVTATLALEGAVLGVFGALWHLKGAAARSDVLILVLIVLSGFAMGIQAAAVRHLGVPGVASTYITGTLTSLMAELVTWLRARGVSSSGEPASSWPTGSASRHLRLLASVFLVYGAGALIGAVLQARSSALLAWLPCVCVAAVVVNGLVRHREPRLEDS
jgi:uncharacterized membrane protein YoaK (UPF0700 family)